MEKNRKNIFIILLLLLILIAWFLYKMKQTTGRVDPNAGVDDEIREISCDSCNNGYPTSQMYALATCPPHTILSGTGNPCPPTSVGGIDDVLVVDTGLTPATPINADGGLYTGDVQISTVETTTAAPLTDLNLEGNILFRSQCSKL